MDKHEQEAVEKLLLAIVKGIVQNPDEVQVHFSEGSDERGAMTMVNVKVHKADVGFTIGKEGNNAEAISRIVSNYAYRMFSKRVYTRIDAPKLPKNHFDYSEKQ